MNKIILTVLGGTLCLSTAFAQNANDILLYTQQFSGGTARSMAMGGAFGALGADISTISTNPAGLGVYRAKNDFMVSFGPVFDRTSTTLGNDKRKEVNNSFPLFNIGFAHTWNFDRESGLKSLTFGLAYNKLSNFSQSAYVDSEVSSSMISDFEYAVNNGQFNSDDMTVYFDPVYKCFLLNEVDVKDPNTAFWSDYTSHTDYTQRMHRTIDYSGGIGEYSFGLGGNINDKLFFGVSLGIQDFGYTESYEHHEKPEFDELDEYAFVYDYSVNGTGINGKFGLIYRPINLLRVGLAVQTPTRFSLKRQVITDAKAWFNTDVGTDEDGYSNEWSYDGPICEMPKFKTITPWRYNASLAAVLGSFAIVSLEGEYLDYSTAKYRPFSEYANPENDVNGTISRDFQGTFNLKGGIEGRLGPVSLRAGAARYGSPFKSNVSRYDGTTMSYSGGIGFRGKSFYCDVAYVYMGYPRQDYDLYRDDPANNNWLTTRLDRTAHQLVFTLGLKW